MAATLLAVNSPAVQVPGTAVYKGNTGQAPPTSIQFTSGAFTGVTASLNSNSKGSDMAQRYGSGGYAIGTGLTLSAGTGLICTVAQGQAVIDGLVEIYTATDVVVTASTTNWIWLKQDGTLVATVTTTKPSGNCVCLGAAITSGSAVTSVDYSGVVYWKGGTMYRETADPGAPGDSPDSSLRFWTKTLGGQYYWDGTAYHALETNAVTSSTASATLAASVSFVKADSTGGAVTLTLPTAASYTGRHLTVKRINGGGNNVILDGASSETIDGALTKTLASQYSSATILSDGTGWHVTASI